MINRASAKRLNNGKNAFREERKAFLTLTETGEGRAELFGEAQRAVHVFVTGSAGDSKTDEGICLAVFLRREVRPDST